MTQSDPRNKTCVQIKKEISYKKQKLNMNKFIALSALAALLLVCSSISGECDLYVVCEFGFQEWSAYTEEEE